eukprot:2406455-Rhodomonas_salina.2
MRCPVLSSRLVVPGDLRGAKTLLHGDHASTRQVPISLRTCCAMSGTDIAYGAVRLRTCNAMSGTDLAN